MEENSQNVWLIAGLACAALLIGLILVLLAVSRRNKKSHKRNTRQTFSTTGTAPAQAVGPSALGPNRIADGRNQELRASSAEEWTSVGGGAPSGEFSHGVYLLGAGQGVRSKDYLRAEPGRVYRLEFAAQATLDATDGGPTSFCVGPLFFDAAGKLLAWWKVQAPLTVAEGQRTGVVEVAAPQGSTQVHIGICGAWAKDGKPGNAVIGFSSLRLTQL